ncbi:MAG: hypothetical protein AB1728_04240 [Bacteroidota bacterium]
MDKKNKNRFLVLFAFAAAFAFVESSVVVYLRALYYPDGFYFPLKVIQPDHLFVELAREAATIIMLVAAGMIAGEHRWERFSYFIFVFGVWDIFYYVWLKVILDWPRSLFDWDILFLIPMPWIGPVIVPVLISFFFIAASILIVMKERGSFHPSRTVWIPAIVGSGLILYSFMQDTDATLLLAIPQPYLYGYFIAGFALYCVALIISLRTPAT